MYELLEIPDLDERRWQKAQAMASYLATTYKNGIIPTTGDLLSIVGGWINLMIVIIIENFI